MSSLCEKTPADLFVSLWGAESTLAESTILKDSRSKPVIYISLSLSLSLSSHTRTHAHIQQDKLTCNLHPIALWVIACPELTEKYINSVQSFFRLYTIKQELTRRDCCLFSAFAHKKDNRGLDVLFLTRASWKMQ